MKSNNDIPKFDLADQIMAEQRKNASVKRKAPAPSKNRISNRDRNFEDKDMNVDGTLKTNPIPTKDNSCDKIISEIVARDIRQYRTHHISK